MLFRAQTPFTALGVHCLGSSGGGVHRWGHYFLRARLGLRGQRVWGGGNRMKTLNTKCTPAAAPVYVCRAPFNTSAPTGGWAGVPQGCIGRGGGTAPPPPLQGAQPMPGHCLPDAKCQPQRQL